MVSGTAAVYGLPERTPIEESCPTAPINPYGRSKLVMEWMLEDFCTAHGLPWASLRYFNAAGADPEGETGEWHEPETHLIPNVLRAIRKEIPALQLFGDDYPTADGTCVRDYIHVMDLASAHALALQYLVDGHASLACNLGTGTGISVREIIDSAERVTGQKVPYNVQPRRAGDPAALVANADKARRELNWEPRYTHIDDIIRTAWQWINRR